MDSELCVCVFAQGKKQEFFLCVKMEDVQLTDVVVNWSPYYFLPSHTQTLNPNQSKIIIIAQ